MQLDFEQKPLHNEWEVNRSKVKLWETWIILQFMKVNYIIIEKLSNICENYTWGPPSANQGISTDSHNSHHVQVTLQVTQGKNWTTQCQPRHFYRQPQQPAFAGDPRQELDHPVPTKAFLQTAMTASMCRSPCRWLHPPPPVPPFLLMQNQCACAQRLSFLRSVTSTKVDIRN